MKNTFQTIPNSFSCYFKKTFTFSTTTRVDRYLRELITFIATLHCYKGGSLLPFLVQHLLGLPQFGPHEFGLGQNSIKIFWTHLEKETLFAGLSDVVGDKSTAFRKVG